MTDRVSQPQGRSTWLRAASDPWLLSALVILLALLLRIHGLGDEALWLDEGYSWWDARQSIVDLWRLVPQCDPHPPLYFLLLKGWIGLFGDDSIALRALSVFLGVATTGVMILAGRQVSPATGWIAGAMFALTPFQIEFAKEARPYTLLCFGAALFTYGALKLLRTMREPAYGGLRGRLVALAALSAGVAIVLWANNTSVLLVAGVLAAFGLLFLGDRSTRRWTLPLGVAIGLAVISWLPYLPVMLEQAQGIKSDFWIPAPDGWRVINELRFVFSLGVHDAFWAGLALAAGGLLIAVRRGLWREAVVLGTLAVVPIVLNLAVSASVKPIFIARAMIGIVPAAILAAAVAITMIRSRSLKVFAACAVLSAHVAAVVYEAQRYEGKEPWDEVARQIGQPPLTLAAPRAGEAGGAVVLLAANELALPLSHALKEIDVDDVALKGAPADFPAPGLQARYPSGKCAPAVREQDLAPMAGAVRGRQVVWFVTRRNNVYDPENRVTRFLSRQGLAQVEVRRFMPGFLEVYKFVREPASTPRAEARGTSRPAIP